MIPTGMLNAVKFQVETELSKQAKELNLMLREFKEERVINKRFREETSANLNKFDCRITDVENRHSKPYSPLSYLYYNCQRVFCCPTLTYSDFARYSNQCFLKIKSLL